MPVLLNVQSNPNLTGSASRATSKVFIDAYIAHHPDAEVQDLDLVLSPPPHLGTDHLGAFFAPPEFHTADHASALAASEKYVAQLAAADVVVIGTPMHNLGIASVLKSWVDNILRIGRTFRYDESGNLLGLLPQKKVVIVVGAGGIYSQGPMSTFDHCGPYLKSVFHFLGMSDVTVILAEGLTLGPSAAAAGVAKAEAEAVAAAA